eukprot:NODE_3555_length_760_cov_42.520394_g2977_i0.p4 GENE.NODE_3555_length_760_cov_42.520394_g2977_i0~~NODE_3555_length_760_cov_42.520394_g2977_i0.p4  ORF type:complete len:61 (+),score=5.62 NODE_3555_length_760_cov_42.520394_g2977_i0:418-600(+)
MSASDSVLVNSCESVLEVPVVASLHRGEVWVASVAKRRPLLTTTTHYTPYTLVPLLCAFL